MHFNPTAVTLSRDAVCFCACKSHLSPSSLRIRSIPCALNFTQQTQLCVTVLWTISGPCVPFSRTSLNWEWNGPQMGLPFFLIFRLDVWLFIRRLPTDALSLLSAANLPGTGRDPGHFSSSAQHRMNPLVACRSRIVHGTCSTCNLQPAYDLNGVEER